MTRKEQKLLSWLIIRYTQEQLPEQKAKLQRRISRITEMHGLGVRISFRSTRYG